jgi:peptide/nickel transport system permease protein
VVIGVAAATFLLLHAIPGDPARQVLGLHASAAAIAALRHRWGLDSSLASQFGRYIGDVVTLKLGDSYVYGLPVTTIIAQRIGETAGLVAIATVIAVAITLPLAAIAASHRDRAADHAVRGVSVIGLGMPSFWLGIVLIEVFRA